ncbi:UDP-3-O-[3-hydroxymyristoyl] glucosamine N-acyltransferase, variant [Aphanomyces invadans]|uniref:UDP-3-O-[3-hydroxymyristoyl] glucosamine N-acyltransferase, variant n=1 Tax=Aphanomyces invadans TaxID=157072 RepID=A0A024UR68_9STRA|nr:UDP-3-O-[3-hydroxymyristoyl] glucosamine N-acyltransferase, variant [Aphanomyces invadans]ETW08906.1 UDP-3-O-[3-hydroxymyristoyl] glucosamine N-acyltransferase, variant [Aphanomyces invadans]|eukprot:XP_008862711.1 UDP-3-O-[3-hydroxymyristoyl] glucosamine N-acyltransferase, variant [Aphanomyces invadans]
MLRRLYSTAVAQVFVHPSAKVDASATLSPFAVVEANAIVHANCKVGCGTVVGEGVVVGPDSHIGSHVTLANCTVGKRTVIHTGTRIGQDGFGFMLNDTGDHGKKPQELAVEIHDDVEIGANCTIDRGSWRNTVVGSGTKMDNLIQIGHNVQIGQGCVLAAQTGIGGASRELKALLDTGWGLGRRQHNLGQPGVRWRSSRHHAAFKDWRQRPNCSQERRHA